MEHRILNNPERLNLMLRLADAGALAASGAATALALQGRWPAELAAADGVVLYAACALAFGLFPAARLYRRWQRQAGVQLALQLGGAWAAVLGASALFARAVPALGTPALPWLLLWLLTGSAALLANRALARAAGRWLRRRPARRSTVAIVGAGAATAELIGRVERATELAYRVQVLCTTDGAGVPAPAAIARVACPSDLPAYLAQAPVDQIWIALPLTAAAEVAALQEQLNAVPVELRWVHDLSPLAPLALHQPRLLGQAVLSLNCAEAGDAQVLAKWLFDKVFALAALAATAPLLVLIALAIRLDAPGPVLFLQPRLGLNGRPFLVYKFRTMRVHADAAVTQATRDDPRVTAVGRFLRRTSLDELPQFLNVLRGEMSVVGPRPHALAHSEHFSTRIATYMARHRAKPGITGWAQIHGARGETDTLPKMERRVQLDLYYLRHWSIWLDLKIVCWTALHGWTGAHVY